MNSSTTVERRASERDRQYTPHEHEELRAVTRWRTKERKPPEPPAPPVIREYKAS